MDNLTHSLTALVLSRAGLNRLAPRADLILLLAANAPDIDVIAWGWGPLEYLRHHRGLSHSLLSLPLLAGLVATLLWLLVRRRGPEFAWGRTWLLAAAGAGSHLLLDLANTYGIRPFMPITNLWYSWDIFYIVDPWVWGVLLVGVGGSVLGRLVSGEIGARARPGRGAALAALLFLVCWCGGRGLLHRRALAMLNARLYGAAGRAAPPLAVAAFPTPLNPLLWRGWVETEGYYQTLSLDVRETIDPGRGQIFYKLESSPALEAARRTRTASRFAEFARYRLETLDRREEGYRVVFTDLRFHAERRNAFVCTIDLDLGLRVIREEFTF